MAATTTENPLVEGLERLPVHPTTLTIFGATGDLAKRKLLPAIYNLAHEGALPERFNLIGSSRSDMPDEDYRKIAKESIHQFSRREPDETVLGALLERVRYVPGSFDDPSVYDRLSDALAAYDEEAGQPLNRAFYLSTAPEFFPVIVERLGAGQPHCRQGAGVPRGRRSPLHHREAVRHDVGRGQGAQRARAVGLRGAPGLPDRPLPGQGDRPEHDGVPVRQRALRAGVEPQLHRQRPDHRGRRHRHRHARGLLRQRRSAARPRAEPHAPAPLPRGDGAAGG